MNSIALITDFGHLDTYAGAVKMAIQSQVPSALVWDVCHEIEPYSILNGGFHLWSTFFSLPQNTILMAIVDPGVGTAREIILLERDSKIILCPNNGMISLWWKQYKNEASCYKNY